MANTKPFRIRVLEAMTESLEQITEVNGYTHNLTGSVFRGRDTFDRDDPLPMVSILESIAEKPTLHAPMGGGNTKVDWELLLQGWTEDDKENPTDPGQYLMAEVKKRLTEERRRQDGYDILGMGGKITDIKFSTGVVRPADEVSARAYFWLKVELSMVENLLDPYA